MALSKYGTKKGVPYSPKKAHAQDAKYTNMTSPTPFNLCFLVKKIGHFYKRSFSTPVDIHATDDGVEQDYDDDDSLNAQDSRRTNEEPQSHVQSVPTTRHVASTQLNIAHCTETISTSTEANTVRQLQLQPKPRPIVTSRPDKPTKIPHSFPEIPFFVVPIRIKPIHSKKSRNRFGRKERRLLPSVSYPIDKSTNPPADLFLKRNKSIRFDDEVVILPTHGKFSYDRSSIAQDDVSRNAQKIYKELMNFKLVEMMVHEDSCNNTNMHMARVEGMELKKRVDIVDNILSNAASRIDLVIIEEDTD
eukprot:CFRG7318T1